MDADAYLGEDEHHVDLAERREADRLIVALILLAAYRDGDPEPVERADQ